MQCLAAYPSRRQARTQRPPAFHLPCSTIPAVIPAMRCMQLEINYSVYLRLLLHAMRCLTFQLPAVARPLTLLLPGACLPAACLRAAPHPLEGHRAPGPEARQHIPQRQRSLQAGGPGAGNAQGGAVARAGRRLQVGGIFLSFNLYLVYFRLTPTVLSSYKVTAQVGTPPLSQRRR